ncbi:YcfP protein [Klebsiella pneumoniae]|uniref:YcfP protein n=1 Tax=Klebsiella pneumoniae TaxID=573 RepID=A0A378BDD1_KLEPN|nr:YcfP protein [Klebsiella pneumoniae]
MIIYLHGFDSNSPGNHEKVMQLQFIDPDVRLISYSTRHPKHDMQHLLKEVDKMLQLTADDRPLICGVGLGGLLGGADWFSVRYPPGGVQSKPVSA